MCTKTIEGKATEALSDEASYDDLNTFIDGLPSDEVPGNFIEYIESWRPSFAKLTPEHQRIAIEKLEEAACEYLGTEEAANLPRLP